MPKSAALDCDVSAGGELEEIGVGIGGSCPGTVVRGENLRCEC